MQSKRIKQLTTFASILALCVVMLGAYTRLTDAGLGCPDWPGCYGQLVLPKAHNALQTLQQQFPDTPIETHKAWTEMAHRYAAGTLVLFIVGIGILSFCTKNDVFTRRVVAFLLGLIAFQAALGMWTVTLKLFPIVVMGHLLGGILIFALLSYLRWHLSHYQPLAIPHAKGVVHFGLIIVLIQIALGGWVSSNYAGIACIGFPQCNGLWVPSLDFAQAFHLFSPLNLNYQGGLLNNEARITIQFMHRLGAIVTAVYLLGLSGFLLRQTCAMRVRVCAGTIGILVILQFLLGIANVAFLLPLWVAVAHNGCAALLLSAMFGLRYLTSPGDSHEPHKS